MRKAIMISSGLGVLAAAAAVATVVWATRPKDSSVGSAGGSVSIDTGVGSGSQDVVVNQQTGQQGGQDGESGQQGSAKPVPSGGNVASATTKSVNSSASSGGNSQSQAQTTDFSQYEQYKSSNSPLFIDTKVGTGAVVANGSKLTVQYRGWLTSGQEFDESYSRGAPFVFTVGEHKVISGWEDGVVGMKVGGVRRLVVPPAFGYGSQQVGNIPPGSVLVFDIELLQVQ